MAMATAGGEREMGFEATELRLGLPGGGETGPARNAGKRGFSETVDLKLKLETNTVGPRGKAAGGAEGMKGSPPPGQKSLAPLLANDPAKPSAPKAQVVGWPPVRSFRKNIMSSVQPADKGGKDESGASPAAFVKVSMDGAPYLRKVDLKMYRSYQELYMALEKMFSSFTIGNCGSQAMNGRDFMSESKLMDLLNGSDYVPTYEDRDGDWMLVGDVPWEMFVESCKRLRIMKGSEAVGLAPRAMEKCKSRS